MKLPRNVSAAKLVSRLQKAGFTKTRQKGSHIILASTKSPKIKLVIPNHSPIAVGTLQSILAKVSQHQGITTDELLGILNL